jgi:hypothetical protein
VMVQQIVGLTKGLQEAKDSEEEARMLHRQRVQMFRGFSARLMEATRCLGIEGLVTFRAGGQWSDPSLLWPAKRQAGGSRDQGHGAHRCRVPGAPRTCRDAHLLQHPAPSPQPRPGGRPAKEGGHAPGTPDRASLARAARLDIALHRLQAIYSCSSTFSAARLESSSSEEVTSSEESDNEEAAESGDGGAAESNGEGEASSTSSQGTGDDESSEEDAP